MAASTQSVWIIYALVVLYALCYQFQRPIEPFLVDKLVKGGGQDATIALGRVESFFNVAQGVGSLVMGWVLDKFGVKTGLIVNFLACAAQYYILSITDSLNMLFLSKVPGMMMGGFLCAQTAMAKVTADGNDRIAALGRLTTAYTIGGLVGPFLGGLLGSTGNYYFGAQLATACSLLAIGLVLMLPSGLDSVAPAESKQKGDSDSQDTGSWLARAVMILGLVGFYLATKVASGIANNMASSVQPIIFKNDLGFDEAMMGTVLSGKFAFGGIANAFLLAPLASVLGGRIELVVRNCIIIMGLTYLAQAAMFASGVSLGSNGMGGVYIGITLFLALFQFSLATSITAKTQELVPKSMLGTLMGIEHSIFAIAGTLGPLLGTFFFQGYGMAGLCLACAALFLSTLIFLQVAAGSSKVANNKNGKKG